MHSFSESRHASWPTRYQDQRIALALVGAGKVGTALMSQVVSARERLRIHRGTDISVVAIANSRNMVLSANGVDPHELKLTTTPCDLTKLTEHLVRSGTHALVVDCSASEDVADRYAGWLHAGIHVVTANKLASGGCIDRWTNICHAGRHGIFRHETTVCAGLPVLQTLRDLVDTGDRMRSLEGMLSGTMTWLLKSFDGTMPFSSLVSEADVRGYTEPDPRDDLSGTDVARKLVILARAAGWELTLKDVRVRGLLDESDSHSPPHPTMAWMNSLDERMARHLESASAEGKVLRYVGRVDNDLNAEVGLVALPPDHPFCHTDHTDNIVQITTDRYAATPILIQGPGAGSDVTASGGIRGHPANYRIIEQRQSPTRGPAVTRRTPS